MQQYHDLIRKVLYEGKDRKDRSEHGSRSIFGYQMRFNLFDGFPIVTTKRTWFRGLATEMLWFLRGETNIKYLVDRNISIWTEWPWMAHRKRTGIHMSKKEFEDNIRKDPVFAVLYGDLGPVYGKQWRDFNGVDQMTLVQRALQDDPYSRRHIVSAWNPAALEDMLLPPCHMMFQFHVEDYETTFKRLSCHVYMRSNDLFLGAPFNIAQYALLTSLMAHHLHMLPGVLVYSIGDAHLYNNHLDKAEKMLDREPYPLPQLEFCRDTPRSKLTDYEHTDFSLVDYQHHDPIPAAVSI